MPKNWFSRFLPVMTLRRPFRTFPLLLLLLAFNLSFAQEADIEPTPADASAQQEGVTLHVVQRGENLYRIAVQYGLTIDDLARFNNLVNPNNLKVGERLLIPLEPVPEIQPPTEHTVQPGETLKTIGDFYGVELESLVQLNGITNPNMLYVGQVLTIVPETEVVPGTGELIIPEELPSAVDPVDSAAAGTLAVEEAAPEVESLDVPENEAVVEEPAGPVMTTNGVATSGIEHVIQRGETLFTIATRYGVSMDSLQDANEISDPSRILAGQVLVIPGTQPVESTVSLPPVFLSLDVTPMVLAQGKTGRIRLTTRGAATVSAEFRDTPAPVVDDTGTATSFLVWLPIPVQTPAGIYPFNLEVTESDGTVTPFSFNIQVENASYGAVNVNLPAEKRDLFSQAIEDNELSILQSIAARPNPQRYFDGPMGLPAAAAMNAPYGTLRSYNGGSLNSYHFGSDFAGAPGSPVLAAASGQVVLTDNLSIRGTAVMIDHGWGVYTLYGHMSQRNVNLGDFVQAGQVIGLVGTTGRSTGAHLHWELWVDGVPVDPMQWVYQAFP
jgi:murein DD-endopeptidase MepM/ murein hydrolase activator NlpD